MDKYILEALQVPTKWEIYETHLWSRKRNNWFNFVREIKSSKIFTLAKN